MPTKRTPKDSTEPAPAEGKRSNLLLQARQAATRRLVDEHEKEFQGYYVDEAKARGVEYTPPLSEEQKAEQQLEAIYEKFPHKRPGYEARAEVPESVTSPGAEPPSSVEAGDLAQG